MRKLIWEDRFSVGVQELDDQHKHLFATINELLEVLTQKGQEGRMAEILESLETYKKLHFATEEKYFKDFQFEGAEEHIAKHHEFSERINEMAASAQAIHTPEFAFKLIDFLEDWLIEHIMYTDQKYVQCFHEHGLK